MPGPGLPADRPGPGRWKGWERTQGKVNGTFGKGMHMKSPGGKGLVALVAGGLLVVGASSVVLSHCEIPCGIYNDPMRLDMMAEEITTIEKSMQEIRTLSAAGDKNYNQLVRWVVNKENHADGLSDTVTQYFMKQRIKPAAKTDAKAYDDYVHKLTLLHEMMITSMKCKQTTDLENVAKLRAQLAEFRTAYLGPQAAAEPAHTH
jgi:nickel superoxide dismutase